MITGLVIGLSVLLQFITAFLALQLIRITGWRTSWMLISAAIFFMGIRRCITLSWLFLGDASHLPDLTFELIGLITSGLMLAGVSMISPLFAAIRRSEEEIQKSEAKYRSLVESTDDSIYLMDRDYRYLFINKKHLARLGISDDGYLGHAYGEFHSPVITEKFIRKVATVFNTGESIQLEHKSERDNEHFLLTLSPVKEPDGKTAAVTVVSKKITELKRLEESLRSLSLSDDLTGLYNRRGFFSLAEQHCRQAKRRNTRVFMLYGDVDDLKIINDTFGHHEGDRALIEIATILKETYRESDIVARIGGDEFVVMPVGNSESSIDIITSRLQKKLEALNERKDRAYRLSITVGIAHFDPEHPCSVDELLAEGDRMMYEQKKKKDLTPGS
jgi:diguanylate cyclase (GGDEF)-like protein/PAS domain S-box-containing protein